jgi:hypothetical protein
MKPRKSAYQNQQKKQLRLELKQTIDYGHSPAWL